MRFPLLCTVLVSSIVLPGIVHAQSPTPTLWLKSDPAGADQFGSSIDISGDVAIVGAPRDNDPLFEVGEYGAAYVYRNVGSGWVEEAKFVEDERQYYAWLGGDVAIDGDVAMVNVRNDEETSDGAVYVYRYTGGSWTEETKLACADRAAGDDCGLAVDVDGDIAVLGAPHDEHDGVRSGTARVFRFDGTDWVEEATLTPDEPAPAMYFGQSVAIDGDRILVGAWGVSGDEAPTGSVYVFEYDGTQWVRTAQLLALDTKPQSQFGLAVALHGDFALVGAPLDGQETGGAGAAHFFQYDGAQWSEIAKIVAHDVTGFNMFGSSVTIDDARFAIGSPNWGPLNQNSTGKAYIYEYAADGSWSLVADLEPEDGGTGDNFGRDIGLTGDVILVGSPNHDNPRNGVGTVYAYDASLISTNTERPSHAVGLDLSPAYPNPFASHTRLRVTTERTEPVGVRLFDLLGREQRVLYEGLLSPHTAKDVVVQADGLPAGIYLVRVETPTHAVTRTATLVR